MMTELKDRTRAECEAMVGSNSAYGCERPYVPWFDARPADLVEEGGLVRHYRVRAADRAMFPELDGRESVCLMIDVWDKTFEYPPR